MEEKYCYRCKKTKPFGEFNKNRSQKYGLHSSCKTCQRIESKTYTDKTGYNRNINAIYRRMKFRNGGTIDFSREWFVRWYGDNNEFCSYCEIPIEILNKIKDWTVRFKVGRNRVFAVDRKDNKGNYNKTNICLACDVCNGLKIDFFGAKDFKEIAVKYIKPRWKTLWKMK